MKQPVPLKLALKSPAAISVKIAKSRGASVSDIPNLLATAVDTYHWKQVPVKVAEYVKAGTPAAVLIKMATARFPEGAGHALLAPLRNELWVVKDNKDFDHRRWEKLACMDTIASVHVSSEAPEDPEGWVYLKTGAEVKKPMMISDVGGIPKKIWDAPGRLIGGHNTATGAITGAALGGLAGYGLGKGLSWLVRKPLKALAPEYFDDEESDWWAPGLAMAGGAAGAALPLWIAKGKQDAHGGNYWGKYNRPRDPGRSVRTASADSVDGDVEKFFDKMATLGGVGAMFRPTINAPQFIGQLNKSMFEVHSPLDAVGNPVISHAIQRPNAFGTRDPYGSRYAPMYTPPPAVGAMAGMVSGAAAARKSSWVSPMDIARMAWGAGSGALSGIIAGKVAGGLAGLNSKGQKKLQQVGLWGGLLSAASRAIF